MSNQQKLAAQTSQPVMLEALSSALVATSAEVGVVAIVGGVTYLARPLTSQ